MFSKTFAYLTANIQKEVIKTLFNRNNGSIVNNI